MSSSAEVARCISHLDCTELHGQQISVDRVRTELQENLCSITNCIASVHVFCLGSKCFSLLCGVSHLNMAMYSPVSKNVGMLFETQIKTVSWCASHGKTLDFMENASHNISNVETEILFFEKYMHVLNLVPVTFQKMWGLGQQKTSVV